MPVLFSQENPDFRKTKERKRNYYCNGNGNYYDYNNII